MSRYPHSPAHILLVDDEPEQLRLLMEMLRGHGYRLTVAFDGIQGHARALSVLPDLILLDVRMPGMDGFAVARLLKANPATEQIPILFLSSSIDLEDRLKGLRSGAADYIVKPFQAAEILERVRIHLELTSHWATRPRDAMEADLDAQFVGSAPAWPDGAAVQQMADHALRAVDGHAANDNDISAARVGRQQYLVCIVSNSLLGISFCRMIPKLGHPRISAWMSRPLCPNPRSPTTVTSKDWI